MSGMDLNWSGGEVVMVTAAGEMMTMGKAVVNGSGMMTVSRMKVQWKMDTTGGKAPENVF
jgi:archaeosine-15-forming tRNA-guanine transglycosylase